MQKKLSYTYFILIAFTLAGAVLASFPISKLFVVALIVFSIIKFLMVAFQFMELKEAHIFWKILLTLYVCTLGGIMAILL